MATGAPGVVAADPRAVDAAGAGGLGPVKGGIVIDESAQSEPVDGSPSYHASAGADAEGVAVDCGWGRVLFAHTFPGAESLYEALAAERAGRRDIAFYVYDPQVLLARAPQELFLDPSHTYRLELADYRPETPVETLEVRRIRTFDDAKAINRIFAARAMVPVKETFLMDTRDRDDIVHLVACDPETGEVEGVVTAIDHHLAIDEAHTGASFWNLAVDPDTSHAAAGEVLVDALAALFKARGRRLLDLSVMHNNSQAIAVYRKRGFRRLHLFCVKRKNPINEPLFVGPLEYASLNPYAAIIVDEARRRGIAVEVEDADNGYFSLSLGGRCIRCRESLSELTTAVAMSRCDDKEVTARALAGAGLRVPAQHVAGDEAKETAFLEAHGRVVVKPARGEQGRGVSVDIDTQEDLAAAIARAGECCEKVLLEEYVQGEDLRVIVIDHEVVAAAVRRPAEVVGTGTLTVADLIRKQSRRRAAATKGESTIPMDTETARCIGKTGHQLDSILPLNERLAVRNTANLHTGGTIHDVTSALHPRLKEVARRASLALDIPVVGLDLLVEDVSKPEYVIVEANERPGLANHEPQPTAQRFIDLLFPQTSRNGLPAIQAGL